MLNCRQRIKNDIEREREKKTDYKPKPKPVE